MRILKWLGAAVLLGVAIAGGLYAARTNPMGPIAGRHLTGELVNTPVSDWSFTDEHNLIAVETRPSAPHSVTTICFAHEGKLYVPARNGASKSWTHYAVSDPRVRLRIDGKVYPARATRVANPSEAAELLTAARAKYDFGDADGGGRSLDQVWLFEVESAPADGGADRD